MALHLLRGIAEFINEDLEDLLFKLGLLLKQLFQDVQGELAVEFKIIVGHGFKHICHKLEVKLLQLVLVEGLYQVTLGRLLRG